MLTGLDPSRPVNSLPNQPLRNTTYSYSSVSDGLSASQDRHVFDTDWAQEATRSFGTYECARFRKRIFETFPLFANILTKEYLRLAHTSDYVQANLKLLDREKELRKHDLNLTETDSNLKLFASDKSKICLIYQKELSPLSASKRSLKLLNKYGIQAPNSDKPEFVLNRLTDKDWWYRKVRQLRDQILSEIERDIGIVTKSLEPYSSDRALRNQRYRKAEQTKFLERQTLQNHKSETFTLGECAATTVSNPAIRRAELMVRIRGFDQVANICNHSGLFFTITTPSRMHRSLSKSGKLNPKFDGTTPKQANQYLCRLWERARAELHRLNITPYGFRVAEPHHDATPHWHLLLFVRPEHEQQLKSVLYRYALQDSPEERGAKQRRITVEKMDPEKGGAAAYIAKYISKNIDGEHLDQDLFGNDAKTTAQRITTWASDHNIRQFQQIGGPSVTVWRELRKLKDITLDGLMEEARSAADSSNWAAYVFAMGGPNMKASERPIKPFYIHVEALDLDTGEIIKLDTNKYGEACQEVVRGVSMNGSVIPTRFFVWSPGKRLKPLALQNQDQSFNPFVLSSESDCAASASWTCVNNCTEAMTTH